MALLVTGTSLGQNPFKIQDTFTWEDLSRGSSQAAKQAQHAWEINGASKGAEVHFFEVRMNAFKERGKFTLMISVLLLPYGFLIHSSTSRLRAAETPDLAALAMTYLDGLLGAPLAERAMRRYGGKILEWLESVAAIYEQEETE
jgi:hypothetical protein